MRTKVTTRKLYQFDELSEAAKGKALEWYAANADWDCEFLLDDFCSIAALFGWSVHSSDVRFSGFASQGDGASFTGEWSPPQRNVLAAVREYAPLDAELHALAARQAALTFPPDDEECVYAFARMTRGRDLYSHEGTVSIDAQFMDDETSEELQSVARGLMRWLYRRLEASYDCDMHGEGAVDSIRENGYEFTADGKAA